MKSEIIKLLKSSKNIFLFCFAVFILSAVLGFLTFSHFEEELPEILEQAFGDLLNEESKIKIALSIMIRNLTASLLAIALGITLFFPVLVVVGNGFLIGLVTKLVLSHGMSISTLAKGILPHAIFELPAFFIAISFGIRIGLALLSPKKFALGYSRKNAVILRFKEASIIYLVVVVPLLIIAALIEVFVSSELMP